MIRLFTCGGIDGLEIKTPGLWACGILALALATDKPWGDDIGTRLTCSTLEWPVVEATIWPHEPAPIYD